MSTTNEVTKTPRQAIIDALATAGVDGMDVDQLDDMILGENPPDDQDFVVDTEDFDTLVDEGVIELIGCSWARLSREQWELRVASLLQEAGVVAGAVGYSGVAKVLMAVLMPVEPENAS